MIIYVPFKRVSGGRIMVKQAKVVHFEVPVDDMERAKKFYTEVFGWQMFPPDPVMGYQSVGTTQVNEKFMPKDPGAINGGMVPREGANKYPIITLDVDDIDAALEALRSMAVRSSHKRRRPVRWAFMHTLRTARET
jgi:predicted enzyme related to lactoylglutathione lyase